MSGCDDVPAACDACVAQLVPQSPGLNPLIGTGVAAQSLVALYMDALQHSMRRHAAAGRIKDIGQHCM